MFQRADLRTDRLPVVEADSKVTAARVLNDEVAPELVSLEV